MRRISPRLCAITEEIKKLGFQDIVYDIGTDHAYLPIHLLNSGACGVVAASDISARSLERASCNAIDSGVSDNIRLYAGNGFLSFPDYKPKKIVVIAGIGGINLINIIINGIDKARAASTLILQPMSGQAELREWLYNNAFAIEFERLVREGNRVYCLLFCRHAEMPQPYAPEDAYIGARVIYAAIDDYIRFLLFERKKIMNRYNGIIATKKNRSYINGKTGRFNAGSEEGRLDERNEVESHNAGSEEERHNPGSEEGRLNPGSEEGRLNPGSEEKRLDAGGFCDEMKRLDAVLIEIDKRLKARKRLDDCKNRNLVGCHKPPLQDIEYL